MYNIYNSKHIRVKKYLVKSCKYMLIIKKRIINY